VGSLRRSDMKHLWGLDWTDVLIVLGVAGVTVGLYLAWSPLAIIVGSVLAIVVGVALGLARQHR